MATTDYIPTPLFVSSLLLTSSQLVAQYEDFLSILRFVSAAPELVFERLVTNLNGAFNATFELERQQHTSNLKILQSSNDELKRTNQELAQTMETCTCSRTRIPDPPVGERPTPTPTLAVTAVRTRSNPHISISNHITSVGLHPDKDSKIIFFSRPYTTPPGIPIGLTAFDIGLDINLSINSYTSSITTRNFKMSIDNWESKKLCSATCSWLEIEADDPDFQFGSYNTLDDQGNCQARTSKEITFKRAYDAPPVVVVWLTGFSVVKGRSVRIRTSADCVTATGFKLNIDTWGSLVFDSAVSSWVAYTAGIPGVCSGSFSTPDLRSLNFPQSENSGYVWFGEKNFSARPRTMLVLNSVDAYGTQDLSLLVRALSVSAEGMEWQFYAWVNTVVYSAGASYIAMS